MPKKKKGSLATLLGHGFAYVQHGTDELIEWGFRQMKKAETEDKKTKPKKPASLPGRMLKGTLSFIGTAGEAFYEKYEDLKKNTRS